MHNVGGSLPGGRGSVTHWQSLAARNRATAAREPFAQTHHLVSEIDQVYTVVRDFRPIVTRRVSEMLSSFQKASCTILLSCAAAMYGQTGQGTVTGSVTDTTGAVISGVSVVVRNQNTGFVYNAVTTPEGIYRVPYLNVGTYEITFSAPGFKKLARKDVPI